MDKRRFETFDGFDGVVRGDAPEKPCRLVLDGLSRERIMRMLEREGLTTEISVGGSWIFDYANGANLVGTIGEPMHIRIGDGNALARSISMMFDVSMGDAEWYSTAVANIIIDTMRARFRADTVDGYLGGEDIAGAINSANRRMMMSDAHVELVSRRRIWHHEVTPDGMAERVGLFQAEAREEEDRRMPVLEFSHFSVSDRAPDGNDDADGEDKIFDYELWDLSAHEECTVVAGLGDRIITKRADPELARGPPAC